MAGRRQLGGASVILAHRLLKNRLRPTAGYVLLTDAALARMAIEPTLAGLSARSERYEHLGEVRCFVADSGALARLTSAAL